MGPQRRHRRLGVFHSARRHARRTSIGTASWAARPRCPSSPVRLFRWRNYRDYGTGVAGDLFVHLFSGMHFVTGRHRPHARVRHRRPALLEGRPRRARRLPGPLRLPGHRSAWGLQPCVARQFRLRCGRDVRLPFRGFRRHPDASMAASPCPKRRAKPSPATPSTLSPKPCRKSIWRTTTRNIRRSVPMPTACARNGRRSSCLRHDYSDHLDHHRNFIAAVRSRQAGSGRSGIRIARRGPGAALELSYFEQRVCNWDPETMTLNS